MVYCLPRPGSILFRGRRDLTRVRLLQALRATASLMQTSTSVLQRTTVAVVAAVAATTTIAAAAAAAAAAVRALVVVSQARMEIKGIKCYLTAGCK